MKTLKISGLLLASSLIIFSSCKKDKDPEPQKSRTELITRAGGWKMTGFSMNGMDFFGYMDECSKDNITKFTTAGTMTVSEGANVCEESEAETGTWKFIDNETKLVTNVDSQIDTLNIAELTATNLKVTASQTSEGQTFQVAATYTGQ